jgi:hypothetical protein
MDFITYWNAGVGLNLLVSGSETFFNYTGIKRQDIFFCGSNFIHYKLCIL